MHALKAFRKYALAGVAALAALALSGAARAGLTVLYAFHEHKDGHYPEAGVIEDSAGNLYGTTSAGLGCGGYGCGTVFKLAPDGTETVLHAFRSGTHGDGAVPYAGLIEDRAGNLYGTTMGGGADASCLNCGIVFEIAPDGTETVLHSFDGRDGAYPAAGLIEDQSGNLYGTTTERGGDGCHGDGCGTVFKLAPDGTISVLHAFGGGNDGAIPTAGLIRDKAGNLYGTTSAGGGGNGCNNDAIVGCGTVFKLAPDGAETVLHAFTGENGDGAQPYAGLIEDKAGNLYGTTNNGGTGCKHSVPAGCGTVFKLSPDGTETVLYAFAGGSDGAVPFAGLIRDKAGNLYGTTEGGGGTGGHTVCTYYPRGCGTVFRLAPDGTETILYAFRRHRLRRGEGPDAGLTIGGDGQLYGTASSGGRTRCNNGFGCGTVFRLTK